MFSHILVPHDFTPAADRAVRAASALAARVRGHVTVLHVITPFYPLRDLAYAPPVLDAVALETQVLARLERHVAKLGGARAVRCLVATGNPGQRIVETARKGVSCIVMPTTGRTGAAHALIGSTAERVVRFAPVPVLVLPKRRQATERRGTAPKRAAHG